MEPADFVDEKRMQKDFDALSELSKDPEGGITRLAYTETETKAHRYVASEAEKLGLKARTDAVGNLYIRMGKETEPAIRIGSHLDSVNNGGNYDGAVGVVTGLEALRCLAQAKALLKYPVELVAFRAEESTRFNRGCIGSQIVTGKLGKKEAKALRDNDEVTLYDAIKSCGYDPENLTETLWDKPGVKLFLEPHIEQGRVLETESVPIGIVTGIADPVRHIVTIEGIYDHSGATPMNLRKDAVAAAAEMTLAAEKAGMEAFNSGKSTVVTVGNVVVPHGSINKIAGKCALYLDIRDINLKDRDDAENRIMGEFEKIAEKRGGKVTFLETQRSRPALVKEEVQKLIAKSCEKLGVRCKLIVSGAAQDAQHIANYGIPAGMIFVPSRGGISHAPEEFTEIRYIALATKVLITVLMEAQEFKSKEAVFNGN